ncbi:hypothetical protein BMW23_0058 [Bodo saltans virus]|uniref:Uncharacterized protein n=1 Tax=Bodo saltans virus TaxID=2024608 RepID=A0A2H4UT42_9VIRU|nr:hypothetical protein QJ851_gp0057 [Bodo saltans virus]ATZ80120.1 hypothetical protein BMW23_0058 [Bodo saltans virus]
MCKGVIEKAIQFIKKDKEIFILPESVRKSTEIYISSSYEFLNFLDDVAEQTEKKSDYITISDLYALFKVTDFYINSSKEEKRDKYALKNMKLFFEKNKNTTLYYKDKITINVIEDGEEKRKQIYSVLTNYKLNI